MPVRGETPFRGGGLVKGTRISQPPAMQQSCPEGAFPNPQFGNETQAFGNPTCSINQGKVQSAKLNGRGN